MDRGRARHRPPAAADRRGRQGVRRRHRAVGRGSRRVPRPGAAGLTRSYTDAPPPATFRFIASPLVTWIWLGGADRVLRRGDRALARRRRRPPPGDGGRPGPRGTRARARVTTGVEIVLVAVAGGDRGARDRAPLRRRRPSRDAADGRARRPRGGPRREVRRDPRRRDGLPDRQALRGRLARAGPPAAARGGRAAPPARRARP